MTSLCSQLACVSPSGTGKIGIRSRCCHTSSYGCTRSPMSTELSHAPGTSESQIARISSADLR